jgi:hypothetical protein
MLREDQLIRWGRFGGWVCVVSGGGLIGASIGWMFAMESRVAKVQAILEKDYAVIMSALHAGTTANAEAVRSADDLWRITKIMVEALSAAGFLALACGIIALSAGLLYLRSRELALALQRLRQDGE